jgi:serine/threonine protein kinase/Flp pilus assembly protein TadD
MSDHSQLLSVFSEAFECPSAEDRQAFLDKACLGDSALRARVEDLLRAEERARNFLEGHAARPDRAGTVCPPLSEAPGSLIGPYKLIEEIGEGGFGIVFMAEQQRPVRRRVAVKVLKPGMDTRQVIARFEAERQALALMDHANIARVLDGGETVSGRPYFVMDLVRGLPITEFCDRHQLTPKQRLELFVSVCQAVQHAHQKGIIHRDIKPSNVLVTLYDSTPVVKIIDFGISKALGQQLTEKTLVTGFAQMIGTPLYMSPEQATLSGLDVDTRSDVYSLGVLLYELLTGTTPFESETLKKAGYDEMRRMIREEEPPRPSTRLSTLGQVSTTLSEQRQCDPKTLCSLLRGELDWIVMKALEKDRNRRYETASALASDAQRFLDDEPVDACPPSRRYRLGKFLHKHRNGVLTAAALVTAVVVVGVGIGWVALDRAARRAEVENQRVTLEQAVAKDLEQADFWQTNNQWAKALQFLEHAKGLLAESGLAALQARVEARHREVALVARLQHARLKGSLTSPGLGKPEGDRLYGAAFAEQGLRMGAADIEETARQIRASAIRHQLVAALDNWAFIKDDIQAGTGAPLRAVVHLADDDAWRRQVRNHWLAKDRQALVRLAESEDVLSQPPGNLLLLSDLLERVPGPLDLEPGARWEAVKKGRALIKKLLRGALLRYPADFWINWTLARDLSIEAVGTGTHAAVAIGFLRAALALQPDYPELHHQLGILLHHEKDLAEAVLAYQKTIELAPNFYDAHIELGDILREQRKFTEAEAVYLKAAGLEPTNAATYLALGGLLMEQRKLPEAIENYRIATKLNPRVARGHYSLGRALQEQQKVPQAEAAYRAAVEISPRYQEVYEHLGNVLSFQNKSVAAEAAFRKGIELMLERREYVLEHRKHVPVEVAGLKELEARLARTHNGLGIALARQNRLAEALQAWRKAIGFNPELGEPHLNLGRALQDLGEFSESLAAFKQAQKLASGANWSKGHAELLRQAEQFALLDAKLPKILNGEVLPAHAAELVGLAALCRLQCRQLYAACARFYREAFDAEPKRADDLSRAHRYDAARAAALAGCGQGKDAANLEPQEHARLRKQALIWLRADLIAWSALEKESEKTRPRVLAAMRDWQQDPDFNGVRDEAALAKLGGNERRDWQKLWKEVEELRKRAAEGK